MEEDQFREYLSQLDMCKSLSPDGVLSQVLRELADGIPRLLSKVFEQSW